MNKQRRKEIMIGGFVLLTLGYSIGGMIESVLKPSGAMILGIYTTLILFYFACMLPVRSNNEI